MSKKPKAQNYKPTEADKANASVALAEYRRFKEKYDPLLQQMRDESRTEDMTSTLRARSNADTMQALTSEPSYGMTQQVTAGSDMAQALQGQLGQATAAGKDIQNKMQTNVLGTARGQAADAQRGMAAASRLATSEALTRAKAKQDVAQAKLNAATQVGTALIAQGGKNMKGGGTFFTPSIGGQLPTDSAGNIIPGPPTRRLASNFRERAMGGSI
ncbi:hypothetical protein [Limnobacter sp.]|uniref:hypothetical protein n=1 Tax=Limnobacter sp. TaxID=2003368 RepID=UPI0025C57DFB|nr:hypothetical protein [Limnobacter sp.]